ncbi:hypothetical protein [Clostridium sp. JNZ J1-5]|nr:hypothetical protein [Clostridium sp.]
MEQKIEKFIDGVLDSLAPQLFTLSIIIGIVLIILGISFIVSKRSKNNIGTISIAVGTVAILSGAIQMFF